MLVGFIPQVVSTETSDWRQVNGKGQPETRFGSHHAIERLLFAGCDRIYVAIHSSDSLVMERHNTGKDYLLPIAYLYQSTEAGLAARLDSVYPFAQSEGAIVVVVFPGHDLSARAVVQCRRMFEAHNADYIASENIVFYKMSTFGQYLRDQVSRGKTDITRIIDSASTLGMRIRTFVPPNMQEDDGIIQIDPVTSPLRVSRFGKSDKEMRLS